MNNLREKLNDLNALIVAFKFHEALNKFYDEEVLVYENEQLSNRGLKAYHDGATEYLKNISNASATLISTMVSDGITVTEWRYMFEHNQWGKWDKVQVSIQRWKNGKIVLERHHYSE